MHKKTNTNVGTMLALGEYNRTSNCLKCFSYLFLSAEFILYLTPASGLPITDPPRARKDIEYQEHVRNLDLRFLDYQLTEDNLGDDLLLEFKSDNLSGIVRLNRIDETGPGPQTSHQQKDTKDDEKEPYDQKGAMYFAVSVVSLYGLSIGVLVAFSLRRDWDEDEVKHFQRSWVKMDHMMEKQEKQRAKNLMSMAITAIDKPSSVATVTSQAVYMALAPAIPFNEALVHGADHMSRMRRNLHQPLGTIAEATGGTATSSVSVASTSPAVSAVTLNEGPVRSPPASRSDDVDWDEISLTTCRDPFDDDESEEMDEIERILEEGQLEAQLSVEMPDGDDLDIDVVNNANKKKDNVVDRRPLVPLRRPTADCDSRGDSSEVFLKPQPEDSAKKTDANKAPLRTLLGLLSPSLPFMDDEVGNKDDEKQEVWTSLNGQRSTQV